ncbi:MAG: glycerate kinase [Alicyclobacillaceae bacterium]|nr:glycerate kinase [Alicyclobacillaceae bacterium]
MKIVLAPDSYKGSLSAKAACEAMEAGIRRAFPDADIVHVPMADGGEGTAESLVSATGGEMVECMVTGPLGERVRARWGRLGDGRTAVIELAEASGLVLVPPARRNPLHTTTYGTGELIADAVRAGCRDIILAIGGSASNDAGAGMAQALGVRLLDDAGRELPPGGGALGRLARIDATRMLPGVRECRVTVACDVDNPLVGPEGASAVFGPQKGATPEMVKVLDDNLRHFADVVERDLGVRVADLPGAGAAGGMGAGAVAFLAATLRRGVEIVIDAVRLEEKLRGADLVLSGEGQCDHQTVRGKTPFGVAQVARRAGVPVVLLAGSLGDGVEALFEHGVTSAFSIVDRPLSLDEAMARAPALIASAAERVVRAVFAAGGGRR